MNKEGIIFAEWDSTLSIPFKAYYELKNEGYREDELVFLCVFHTYLHAG